MRPYEIYYAKIQWKGCEDERPWVIIGEPKNSVFDCFPLSTQDLAAWDYFEIDPDHPDFELTGLSKRCHILYESIVEIDRDSFSRRKGELLNDMLDDFLRESGL